MGDAQTSASRSGSTAGRTVTSLDVGKLFSFCLLIVAGSLLQLWLVLVVLLVVKRNWVGIEQLLGDGGLLFFSTALVVSGAIQLLKAGMLRWGSPDFNITTVATLLSFLSPVAIYAAIIPNYLVAATAPQNAPFVGFAWPQIACSGLAVVYLVYAAFRTGEFR